MVYIELFREDTIVRRRIISIILMLALAINLLSLSGCSKDGGEAVTRGQWLMMLTETFGMDSYTEETPYYDDVQPGTALFPYVQSAKEWNVLDVFPDSTLEVDKNVTRGEAAASAAVAAGYGTPIPEEEGGGIVFDMDEAVSFAVQRGILADDKGLSKTMTAEECQAVLDAARDAYLSAPVAEKLEVTPDENLRDLSELDAETVEVDGDRLTFPAAASAGVSGSGEELKATIDTGNGVVEVGVGEIFVMAPTPEHPAGVAYKVDSIAEVDGQIVFTTVAPELNELYEELSVQQTVAADTSNILWLVGGEDASAETVSYTGDNTFHLDLEYAPLEMPVVSFLAKSYEFGGMSKKVEFGSGSFEKNYSNRNSSVIGSGEGAQALTNSNFVYNDTPSIEDFGGSTDSWDKKLEIENSFSGGYKITGEISINALTVTTGVEYKRTKWLKIPYGVESASVQVNSDITSSLKLEGNLKERLRIATVPIPIAATGLSVSVDLYLYADANGSITVTASLGSNAKVEYTGGRLRHTASSKAEANVDANLEINFGAELCASLDALGIVKIVDAGAKVGGNLSASAGVGGSCEVSEEDGVVKTTYRESLNIHADLYVPLINVYAGGSGTLINKIGLSGNWDIMTKDKGAKHIELCSYEWVFWEETVLTDKDGNTESETTTAGEEDGVGATDEDTLDLLSYVVTLNGAPEQLLLDVPEGQSAPAVTWQSDDPSIATVDASGLVTPVSTGQTMITVTLQSDPSIYVKCAVYVEAIGEENWEFLPSDMAYWT